MSCIDSTATSRAATAAKIAAAAITAKTVQRSSGDASRVQSKTPAAASPVSQLMLVVLSLVHSPGSAGGSVAPMPVSVIVQWMPSADETTMW